MKAYTDEEKKRYTEQLRELRAGGMTTDQAAKKLGIGISSAYAWLAGHSSSSSYGAKAKKVIRSPRRVLRRSAPILLPVPLAPAVRVLAFYGTPKELAELARSL